jgi:hypothetical protein
MRLPLRLSHIGSGVAGGGGGNAVELTFNLGDVVCSGGNEVCIASTANLIGMNWSYNPGAVCLLRNHFALNLVPCGVRIFCLIAGSGFLSWNVDYLPAPCFELDCVGQLHSGDGVCCGEFFSFGLIECGFFYGRLRASDGGPREADGG